MSLVIGDAVPVIRLSEGDEGYVPGCELNQHRYVLNHIVLAGFIFVPDKKIHSIFPFESLDAAKFQLWVYLDEPGVDKPDNLCPVVFGEVDRTTAKFTPFPSPRPLRRS
jgi:hypothetical protein